MYLIVIIAANVGDSLGTNGREGDGLAGAGEQR